MRKEGNCTARKIEQVSRSLENSKVEGCEDLQGERVVYGHVDFFFWPPAVHMHFWKFMNLLRVILN